LIISTFNIFAINKIISLAKCEKNKTLLFYILKA